MRHAESQGETLTLCGADMIHGKLTKEKIIADVDRLLNELRDGTGEYEGEGADGFPQLQEWKPGPERMLDWEQTKRNVDDYIKALRHAIVEVKNWRVVDMMLYPVPGYVATPGWDDPLTYDTKLLADLERLEETT